MTNAIDIYSTFIYAWTNAVTGTNAPVQHRLAPSFTQLAVSSKPAIVRTAVIQPLGVPIIPVDLEDEIDTNSITCYWYPSTNLDGTVNTNVNNYGLALGNVSGQYLFTNWYGNVTNAMLTATNPLPWYVVAIAGDQAGDFSPPSNEIGWNGTMVIDVTNYVTLTLSYTFTNPTGNNFFRLFQSSDLHRWSDSGISPQISNLVTSITTNAPMP